MKNLIENPPRTIMEVYNSLPEGTLAELIDNTIYMSPSPVFRHQSILQKIFRQLADMIIDKNLGEVLIAPFDVYLDEVSNAVQPDIIVVLKANDHILDREGTIHGVPDLLIEILSEGNETHDTVRKKKLYERFGVKEYWIVNPVNGEATGFTWANSKYSELDNQQIGTIRSKLLNLVIRF